MKKLTLLLAPFFLAACGGAGNSGPKSPSSQNQDDVEVRYGAEDFAARAELARAELTTAVDAKRYRAAGPVTDQFRKSEPVIYLVGRLKKVPTDATIEVRWFLDEDPRPMLVSNIQGSDNFQFIADFRPAEAAFEEGAYSARVFINDKDIGGISFVIGDPEAASSMSADMVSGVKFSKQITGNMKPKKPSTKFKSGTKKLYVSFDVKGAPRGSVADIHWYRGEESFHSAEVVLQGNRRYGVHVESPSGLPDGEYKVEIYVAQQLIETATAKIGNGGGGGPTIDDIALGLTLKTDNMPQRRLSRFKRDTAVIQCGLRFLDLPEDSTIEIQWLVMEDGGEVLLYKNRSNLSTGGSGTMGAAWEPTHELSPGNYKVAVLVNDEPLREESFEIE